MITALVAALILAAGLMAVTFALALWLDNFSIVDVAWSFNFTPVAALYMVLSPAPGWRRGVVLAVVAVWSLRLAGHLARRIAALHPVEEGRYLELRRQWANNVQGRFFRFFMIQGGLNVLLSTPILFLSRHVDPALGLLEGLGLALFVTSLAGEALADAQLAEFKRDPASKGRVCDLGLWRYSRHPNYFFEWLVWCAFALMATAVPWGFLSWVCPALMLYFLLRVTGIPMTEEQAIRSRGEAYRNYQATTSAFVPWFPRTSARKVVHLK
jgi:steroid 5-alpha reductase family enzyme